MKSCRTNADGMQPARYHCTQFYWRGWDFCVHDEHTGVRGGYGALISVTYAINTG